MRKILFLVGIIFLFATEICVATEKIPTIGELLILADELGIDNDVVELITYGSGTLAGITIQGKEGYYPSRIAKDFCNVDHYALLEANGINEEEAWSLSSNYTLFIPLEMLKDEFRNPLPKLLSAKVEIKSLKERLRETKNRLNPEKIITNPKENFFESDEKQVIARLELAELNDSLRRNGKNTNKLVENVEQMTKVFEENFQKLNSSIKTMLAKITDIEKYFIPTIIAIFAAMIAFFIITRLIFRPFKKN